VVMQPNLVVEYYSR